MTMVSHQPGMQQQRAKAVITAWVLAVIAVAIFVGFILSGVLAS
jgi:hypothetical protein